MKLRIEKLMKLRIGAEEEGYKKISIIGNNRWYKRISIIGNNRCRYLTVGNGRYAGK